MFYTLKTVDLTDLDKQIEIRQNHGISVEMNHIFHKNCKANHENDKEVELETVENKKENMIYEIIEVNENETATQPENAKENTYNITRRKRKAIAKRDPKVAKKVKTSDEIDENDNTNIFKDGQYQTNSEGEGDEENTTQKCSNKEIMQYECEICSKKYKMFMCYKKHMLDTHNKELCINEFKCDCGKIFTTKEQLQTHERLYMSLGKSPIPCQYCNKTFTKENIMKQHIKEHHFNVKPYICDECGKALKTMAALNEHKLVHTNDCPFECEVCHKRFKNKARLKIHSDVHAQSYNCNVCGLLLNTRRTLRMHMLVHSEEKQFKCDFCSQAFKRGKALKNHLILHIGLRPYKCTFCDRAFANNSNCRAHKKKVHPHELAQEEAKGIKSKAVVPLLHELRNSCLNSNSITQKETEDASKNLETFMVAIDDYASENLEEKTNSPNISIEKANESDDYAQQYSFCDEEFVITKAEDDEEEGTETIVYEVLGDLT